MLIAQEPWTHRGRPVGDAGQTRQLDLFPAVRGTGGRAAATRGKALQSF